MLMHLKVYSSYHSKVFGVKVLVFNLVLKFLLKYFIIKNKNFIFSEIFNEIVNIVYYFFFFKDYARDPKKS